MYCYYTPIRALIRIRLDCNHRDYARFIFMYMQFFMHAVDVDANTLLAALVRVDFPSGIISLYFVR